FSLDLLGLDDLLQPLGNDIVGNRPELEALAARNNRRQNLLRLGRREDELHMWRWLLQRLQQRVEGLRREHVDLVDDIDLEGALGRRVLAVLPQVPDLVDGVV